jgi:hypothetical protein
MNKSQALSAEKNHPERVVGSRGQDWKAVISSLQELLRVQLQYPSRRFCYIR